MHTTAVVILNYNGVRFLEKFLPNVIENSPQAEVIVADNGSTDNSVEWMRINFPNVRLITLDINYGFAGGYNLALKEVKSDYYVLLNSDIEVTKDWLVAPIAYLEQHKEAAACQPKILSYNNKQQFEYAGANGGYIDKLGYPFCRGRILSTIETDHNQYDEIKEIFWATGAALFIRADLYHSVGGLDYNFFCHMEEIDLCWRLKARGWSIVCVPQSTVYHVGGGTLAAESPMKTYYNFRNNLSMIYKNIAPEELKKVLAWRLVLDWAAALHLLVQGKFANCKMVFKARHDHKIARPRLQRQRNENLCFTTCQKPKGMINKSILLEYYFKGHKLFSKL